ncbi:MAG: DinB family protein [Sulfobacillus sp.]
MWTSQVYYHEALKCGGSVPDYREPHEGHPVRGVEEELSLSQRYFERFLDYVGGLSDDELATRMIDRSNVGYIRSVGDMLARIAYHESVHTGQLLQYMRMAGVERPQIWD